MGKKKAKLPKRIAGFKIPKGIRRDYKPLLQLLARAEVQAVVGTALAAGVAAFAEQTRGQSNGKKTARKLKRRLKFFTAEGQDQATEMAQSVGRTVGVALASYLPHRSQSEKHATVTH